MSAACDRAVDPQTRIDDVIENVDHEIDHDEEEADEYQIDRHHRNVDKRDRLDEEKSHTRPLEDLLRDDRERDDRAELNAGYADDGHERIFKCVPEIDRTVGKAARTGELDV